MIELRDVEGFVQRCKLVCFRCRAHQRAKGGEVREATRDLITGAIDYVSIGFPSVRGGIEVAARWNSWQSAPGLVDTDDGVSSALVGAQPEPARIIAEASIRAIRAEVFDTAVTGGADQLSAGRRGLLGNVVAVHTLCPVTCKLIVCCVAVDADGGQDHLNGTVQPRDVQKL
eukprot:COSAG02_NODE_707_length_18254_cov_20.685872_4_plen_172_part_00